jgi:L,D-transpeptidase YcbB
MASCRIIKTLGFCLILYLMPGASTVQAETHQAKQLGQALAFYEQQARYGEWSRIPPGVTIRPGMEDKRIPLLRKRLTQQQLYFGITSSTVYDTELVTAVQNFQEMHGLEAKGIVGKQTIEALNVPLSKRIKQLQINKQRWELLPEHSADRYILVNIAGFTLSAIENGKEVLAMKIISGKPNRKTPLFSSVITDVTFHPYWHVPTSIAKDKLEKIQKDPSYLRSHGFSALDQNGTIVPLSSINWSTVTKDHFPYLLRQAPGDRNALGKIRFSIDNTMDIYMHGTPEQKLFSQTKRAESSGCIRVEFPLQLAHFVMNDIPDWPPSRIYKIYNYSSKTVKVPLPKPLAVHIMYFTSWVDSSGKLQFRNDVYGLDY